MSDERIIRRKLSEHRKGKTDWAEVDSMTEAQIDQAARSDPDAQPTDAAFWKDAVLVNPSKQLICLRVDQDLLDWFKGQGKGYQTRMNAVLRAYMEAQTKATNDK
ncbi:MAG: BrnA antitoxin family protein [Dehalococcoidia bacterium]